MLRRQRIDRHRIGCVSTRLANQGVGPPDSTARSPRRRYLSGRRKGGPAIWPCSTGGRPSIGDSLQPGAARFGLIDRGVSDRIARDRASVYVQRNARMHLRSAAGSDTMALRRRRIVISRRGSSRYRGLHADIPGWSDHDLRAATRPLSPALARYRTCAIGCWPITCPTPVVTAAGRAAPPAPAHRGHTGHAGFARPPRPHRSQPDRKRSARSRPSCHPGRPPPLFKIGQDCRCDAKWMVATAVRAHQDRCPTSRDIVDRQPGNVETGKVITAQVALSWLRTRWSAAVAAGWWGGAYASAESARAVTTCTLNRFECGDRRAASPPC
jgi:hypothetical protein